MKPILVCHACPRRSCSPACVCTVNGKPVGENAAAYECPESRFPARGLGDVVAKVMAEMGVVPCGGCKERQEWLNGVVPFKEGR